MTTATTTSEDERNEVRAGLAEIQRGELSSDEEVASAYQRMGL